MGGKNRRNHPVPAIAGRISRTRNSSKPALFRASRDRARNGSRTLGGCDPTRKTTARHRELGLVAASLAYSLRWMARLALCDAVYAGPVERESRRPSTDHIETDENNLGKLKIFAGVLEFPARVKCASLSWHTLNAALRGEEVVSTE